MYENGIIVVGGGHGGSQLVASLRGEGYDGPLTLLTAETDIPYQRPPLSKAFLKDAGHDLLPLRPESFYAKNAIRLLLSAEVSSVDLRGRQLRLADGAVLSFDGLALATGARPRLPPVEGTHLAGVHVLRVAAEARALRDRLAAASDVVVVGGGFIGLEVAATARLLGKTVTVLEATDRLMGRVVAPEISRHFLDLHRGWGSDIRLNTPVGRIVGEGGRVVAVETAAGDRIPADLALMGIGVEPNVGLAGNAGLAVENGIVVDETMSTAAPGVVAVGDCVSFPHWQLKRRIRLESVENAVDQAKTAAKTLLGRPEPFREVPWFWSDQGDVKLQMVGLPFGATRSVVRGRREDNRFSVFHFAGDRLLAIDSVNRAADHMVGRRLLAAGISPTPEICADETIDLKALAGKVTAEA
ncbi:MAG TPA: FAD-dependent oxidoreductase [Bauldia sp.]|nr:FAD-dependent oxidoreductase [Bauldia sp.]